MVCLAVGCIGSQALCKHCLVDHNKDGAHHRLAPLAQLFDDLKKGADDTTAQHTIAAALSKLRATRAKCMFSLKETRRLINQHIREVEECVAGLFEWAEKRLEWHSKELQQAVPVIDQLDDLSPEDLVLTLKHFQSRSAETQKECPALAFAVKQKALAAADALNNLTSDVVLQMSMRLSTIRKYVAKSRSSSDGMRVSASDPATESYFLRRTVRSGEIEDLPPYKSTVVMAHCRSEEWAQLSKSLLESDSLRMLVLMDCDSGDALCSSLAYHPQLHTVIMRMERY